MEWKGLSPCAAPSCSRVGWGFLSAGREQLGLKPRGALGMGEDPKCLLLRAHWLQQSKGDSLRAALCDMGSAAVGQDSCSFVTNWGAGLEVTHCGGSQSTSGKRSCGMRSCWPQIQAHCCAHQPRSGSSLLSGAGFEASAFLGPCIWHFWKLLAVLTAPAIPR